jgi:hypothetical protein
MFSDEGDASGTKELHHWKEERCGGWGGGGGMLQH